MIRPSRFAAVPSQEAECTRQMRDPLRGAIPHLLAAHGADLSTLERFVLTKIDGRRSVTDLAGLVEISVDEALAIVLSLLEREVVRLERPKAPQRRASSGFRPRAVVEEEVVTLAEDDFIEVFDDMLVSDDPADAAVFAAPTIDGTMRAITPEQAERLVACTPARSATPPPRPTKR